MPWEIRNPLKRTLPISREDRRDKLPQERKIQHALWYFSSHNRWFSIAVI
jgi:hypothetical protein